MSTKAYMRLAPRWRLGCFFMVVICLVIASCQKGVKIAQIGFHATFTYLERF